MGQIGAWVDPTKQIVVIGVESGTGKAIAEATDRSRSPKGDRIVYEDLESTEFQPIGLPQVRQSAWSGVSARY